jgi:hypothetical protein
MLLTTLLPSSAQAATQLSFKPGAVLAGGLDDNLLFNGSGGDRVGRAGLNLDFKGWDRLWNLSFNLGVSLYGFQERQRIVPLGESTLNGTFELDRWDVIRTRVRARGSDDPLGLAQIGLLGAAGNVLGYRSFVEYEHGFDPRWSVATVATFDGITYFDPAFSDHGGYAAGGSLQPRFKLQRDLTLQLLAGGRTFFSQGVVEGYSLDLMPGIRYRLARRLFVEADVGPALFHDSTGFSPLPVARGLFEYDDRNLGARLTAGQDLSVPNGHSGVLLMELVEGMVRWGNVDWEFRTRAGYYRSLGSLHSSDWQPGYGLQAEAHRRLVSFVWLGVSGVRFDRLATQYQPGMARDAIYLQLDLTQGRP